ncbi:glycosyltransferase [bacterium]|nr:glycosyltransferase [bacterium]
MDPTPLKILQLRSHAGFYGVEKVVVELSAGLQAMGHRVTVGIIQHAQQRDSTFRSMVEKEGLACRLFTTVSPFDRHTIRQVSEFIKNEQPNIIHSHGYKADFVAWMAGRPLQASLISSCHPWLDTDDNRRAALYALIDKLILLRFDRVVAVSEQVRWECHVGPLRRRDIPVIANGVAMSSAVAAAETKSIRQELNIPCGHLLIGCVARLTREKGHLFLLKAFADVVRRTVSPAVLLLLGDGLEKEPLQQACQELGLQDRVHFLGHRADVPALLHQLDLFILPSLSEGIPMALLEAMAAAVPVLSTMVGGIPDILDHGQAGVLVPPGDAPALAAALLELIHDRTLREALAQRGHLRVETAFSRTSMCQRYAAQYAALLRQRNGGE